MNYTHYSNIVAGLAIVILLTVPTTIHADTQSGLANIISKVSSALKEFAGLTMFNEAESAGIAASEIEPYLQKGTYGDDVKTLQAFLRTTGDFEYEPTGYFGLETQQALKDFQDREISGLSRDEGSEYGDFGPLSKAAARGDSVAQVAGGLSPTSTQLLVGTNTTELFCSEGKLKVKGPGGGGRMPHTLISPHNPRIVLVGTDMGTVFHSVDGGSLFTQVSGEEIHSLFSRLRTAADSGQDTYAYTRPWAWHPKIENHVFAGTRYGFLMSTNQGRDWEEIGSSEGSWESGPYLIKFSPVDAVHGTAAFETYTYKGKTYKNVILHTYNSGKHWFLNQETPFLNDDQTITGFVYDGVAGQRAAMFIATRNKVYYRSAKNEWSEITTGLPSGVRIERMDGISEKSKGRQILLTISRSDSGGSQVYKLNVSGTNFSWNNITNNTKSIGRSLTFAEVNVAPTNPDVMYLSYEGGRKWGTPTLNSTTGDGGLIKSSDGGNTWQEVFYQHEKHPRFNSTALTWLSENDWSWAQKVDTVTISPHDENVVFTSASGVYRTENGGKTWQNVATARQMYNGTTPSQGIPVLTVMDYHINPLQPRDHYFSSSDFALWQSFDWGYRWIKRLENNNIYDIDFVADTSTPQNKAWWAVGGQEHDIPHWSSIGTKVANSNGQVFYSEDNFATSQNVGQGKLPTGVVTSLYIEEKANNSYTTWVTVFGKGIYYSADKGQSWLLFTPSTDKIYNRNYIDIGPLPDGSGMYALVTARNRGGSYDRGNLYYFKKDAKTGNYRTENKIAWSNNITYPTAVSFGSDNTVFISGDTTPFDADNQTLHGGVWRSLNLGTTWERVFDVGAASVTVDPRDKSHIFASIQDFMLKNEVPISENYGLFESFDGGSSWQRNTHLTAHRPNKVRVFGDEVVVTTMGNNAFVCE